MGNHGEEQRRIEMSIVPVTVSSKICVMVILIILIASMRLEKIKAENLSQSNPDSIFQVLDNTNNTKAKIDILNQISTRFLENNQESQKDSLKMFTDMAIQLSRKLNYKKGLALALYNIGKYHISTTRNYAEATPCLLESLELYEDINDSRGISKCHLQIGLISYILQYFEDAIKNFKESLKHSDNPTSKYLMALSYSELDSIEKGKKYFAMAIQDFTKNGNQSMLDGCYMYLGKLFNRNHQPDSAFYYLNKAIEDIKAQGATSLLIRPYAFISTVYLQTNNINKSIYYAEASYKLSQNSIDIISLIEAATTLAKAYKIKGDYKRAFFFLDLLNKTNESFFKGSIKQRVAEMQSTFEFKKNRQKDSLSNEKDKLQREMIYKEAIHSKNTERNIIFFTGLGILILAGGLWSRLRYTKRTSSIIKNEKERAESLLLNILPFEVAEELKTKGTTTAKLYDNVSVLFTDFVNFTRAGERMSPQVLIDELHDCFRAFDEITYKYNIEKIKTIGDAYLAVSGLPKTDSRHAENVVNAAIEINSFMAERLANFGEERTFSIRIGIHSGSVVAGIVGVKKFAYDIWGDTVNTAARMEEKSKPGYINISGTTYELVKDKFKFTYRGKIAAKNKGEVDMYFVDGRI
jgi:class 3 adenylate cyclase/Tfp pilus assembly protein PilF